jgi:hypothetical protein
LDEKCMERVAILVEIWVEFLSPGDEKRKLNISPFILCVFE